MQAECIGVHYLHNRVFLSAEKDEFGMKGNTSKPLKPYMNIPLFVYVEPKGGCACSEQLCAV